jgi:hypothetical protein
VDDHYKHPVDEKKVKFKQNATGTKKDNVRWVIIVTLVSFLTSAALSAGSSQILNGAKLIPALLIVLGIVLINIVFDTIGTAVTAADETPFHAMASRKMYGAKKAIRLIRNADKVSNLCNDVVGDICGVISGSASAIIIVLFVTENKGINIIELAITGAVASLTVGGKALGKIIAISNCNYIVYKVGVVLQFVTVRIRSRKGRAKSRK